MTVAADEPRRARWFSLYPLLFAAYPVLFLWSQNVGEANPADVLPVLVIAIAVAAGATALLTLLFRDARRAALVVTPLVLGFLMYGHLANVLHTLHVRPIIQQAAWILFAVAGLVAAIRLSDARIRQVATILDRVSIVLVAITFVIIVPFEISAASRSTAVAQTATAPATSSRPLRDVYYLILDRYGSDRSLKLRFGVDNDLTPWLTDHGFRVLPDSHANYVKTSMSIASTLNMTHLVDLATQMGPNSSDHEPIFAMLQNSPVVQEFKALGYRYLHVGSHFEPTQTDVAADRNLYAGGPSDFAEALIDVSAIPVIAKHLHISHGDFVMDRAFANGTYDWKALASIEDEPGPKFVWGHFLLPHPPYVFAPDGHQVVGAERKAMTSKELFEGHLAFTNAQLEAFIKSVQALPPDRQPIIIVQADEGPYTAPYQADQAHYDWSTASPAELQMKYGILNAWYFPDGTDPGLYDSMTSVNTFPTLFDGYFGLNVPKLEDRSYTSKGKFLPYDLTEITDRLKSYVP